MRSPSEALQEDTMTRFLMTALSLTAFLGVTACETVKGAGQDVEDAGEAVTDAAVEADT